MQGVLKATYSDLRTVKTRSTCQLILEMPIEALTEVVGLLGAPVPGNEVWVAVARLMTEKQFEDGIAAFAEATPPRGPQPALPKPKGASLAQIAGILCNEGAFWKFSGNTNAAEAAEWLRGHCNVASRADLDKNEDAAAAFRGIKGEYEFWMRGEAA